MPLVGFDSLPDDARLWVFAADRPLDGGTADALLQRVDEFLREWRAHGTPLRCARDWREDRFLAIGVDQGEAGASGCSIDGLFRVLQGVRAELGVSLLPGPHVYWRNQHGEIQRGARTEFVRLASAGAVGRRTQVFDTTVSTVADWHRSFERPAAESWHGELLSRV